ncbi:sensor histidine kinase [Teredinibacter haidensis]|uniref:sensor histidine kinase n=1 Tax=Teredinibacter haidensis TaxID=2731755 RepID=UPI0009491419|nr:histidine kinase [Teredinibacter haidensis]
MPTPFLPDSRNFWLYHCFGLLALAVIEVATILFAPHAVGFKIWGSLVLWPVLFTFSVLGFRWLYKFNRFFQVGVGQLIPLIVLYSLITATVSATAMTFTLLPFYLPDFVSPEQLAANSFNLLDVALPIIIGGSLSGHLFVMAWAFIYVFAAENRRAKQSELRNLRLQNNLKEMQLSHLASQLNPHFLFNALNNIRFLIHENPQKADGMITVLSEILRYSLACGSREQVTLEEELAVTRQYVDVVAVQYEDKLTFSCSVPDVLNKIQVPPMCIQMLVENAVKHGLEHLREGGCIAIQGELEALGVKVTVTNPVPDTVKLDGERNTGTGLKNIRDRLQLLYQENAVLNTRYAGRQFIAELFLPREQ